MDEFEIINQFFLREIHDDNVLVSIGDDAAIIDPKHPLAITTDTLVESIHFFKNSLPFDIGYKSLAVNLSDLAAMGAKPLWGLLNLTLPDADPNWLQAFKAGFFHLADQYDFKLIGGDITKGPLSITLTAIGKIKKPLTRKGAKPNDLIYTSGTLGDANAALAMLEGKLKLDEKDRNYLLARLNHPQPRVHIGQKLNDLASACIDISDGLVGDLNHILASSNVGAMLYVETLPLSPAMQHIDDAISYALNGGDDYELCFTVPKDKEHLLATINEPVTLIGKITKEPGLKLMYQNGKIYHGAIHSYKHF